MTLAPNTENLYSIPNSHVPEPVEGFPIPNSPFPIPNFQVKSEINSYKQESRDGSYNPRI
jgi:hypothetical protein